MFYHETAKLHKQAVSEIHWKTTRPPRHLQKIVGDRLAKCIFVTKNALCRHLRVTQGTFGPSRVTFWTLLAVYGSKKPCKLQGDHQRQATMRQNHPKMGFGGILDRLDVISIPSISISKGIKNLKKITDLGSQGSHFLSPDWLATWPPMIGAQLPPLFFGV